MFNDFSYQTADGTDGAKLCSFLEITWRNDSNDR